MTNRQSVIRLVLYGDVSERALKELAFRVEDDIASLPVVSYVETSGVRNYEISIEVPLHRLRAAGVTIEDVSNAVRRGSLDIADVRDGFQDVDLITRYEGQGAAFVAVFRTGANRCWRSCGPWMNTWTRR